MQRVIQLFLFFLDCHYLFPGRPKKSRKVYYFSCENRVFGLLFFFEGALFILRPEQIQNARRFSENFFLDWHYLFPAGSAKSKKKGIVVHCRSITNDADGFFRGSWGSISLSEMHFLWLRYVQQTLQRLLHIAHPTINSNRFCHSRC